MKYLFKHDYTFIFKLLVYVYITQTDKLKRVIPNEEIEIYMIWFRE
jgi:hypothetical protein